MNNFDKKETLAIENKDDSYVKSVSEDDDSDLSHISDIEMEKFIANQDSDEYSDDNPVDSKSFIKKNHSDDLNFLSNSREIRKFKKLKKVSSDSDKNDDEPAIPKEKKIKTENDFIVDDIEQKHENKDDYEIEIKGSQHSSEAMRLATSIFGDLTDFLNGTDFSPKNLLLDKKENKKLIKPSTLTNELKYQTGEKKETKIFFNECPERLCVPKTFYLDLKKDYLTEMTYFVQKRLFKTDKNYFEKIKYVLNFFVNEQIEVPFIELYRPEVFKEFELNKSTLWEIFNVKKEFYDWFVRKEKAKSLIERKMDCVGDCESLRLLKYFLEHEVIEEMDIESIFSYLSFLSGCLVDGKKDELWRKAWMIESNLRERIGFEKNNKKLEKIFKQNNNTFMHPKKTILDIKSELLDPILKIGTSFEITKKLKKDSFKEFDFKIDNINENEKFLPSDEEKFEKDLKNCFESVKTKFKNMEELIKFIENFLAREVGTNPIIRYYSCSIFVENSFISTSVTQNGKEEIDWLHEYVVVSKIERKPISTYFKEFEEKSEDDMLEQFAILTKASKESKIQITFELSDTNDFKYGNLEKTLNQAFNIPKSTSRFSKIKKNVILKALSNYILPHCKESVCKKILRLSDKYIAEECCKSLKSRINTKGLKTNNQNVIGISVGETSEPVYLAVTNSEGILVEYAKFNFLKNISGKKFNESKMLEISHKNAELEKLKKIIKDNMPQFIVIGAINRFSEKILSDLKKICMLGSFDVKCELINPEVAKIFERSKRSFIEFSEYSDGIRNAISLVRYALDPLSEICYMASGNEESSDLLSLNLHAQQKLVQKSFLFEKLKLTLVEEVNRVGLKISNILLNSFHKNCMLEFLCGGGINFRRNLIKNLKSDETTRSELAKIFKSNPKIYKNCVSFLILDNINTGPIERSRIHPELYTLTKEILLFALNNNVNEKDSLKTKTLNKLVKKATKNLRILIDFNYEKCVEKLLENKELVNAHGYNLNYFVNFIVNEIKNPFFCDLPKFKTLTDEELFWLISNESKRTFRSGKFLTATVISISKDGAICSINNEFLGKIPVDNFFDYEDLDDKKNPDALFKEKIKIGMTLNTRISEIEMTRERFIVILDARKSTMENKSIEDPSLIYYPKRLDPFLNVNFLEENEKINEEKKSNEKQKKKKKFISRNIDFLFFKNFSKEEAEEYLKDKDVGGLVLRPSSKGVNFLTATWKISKDPFICAQIEIHEKNKVNSFSLGSLLEIGKMQFEDLDEIYARFFERMTSRVKEMMSFRRFRFGIESDVEKLVLFEKRENSASVPYSIGFSLKHPGCLIIYYVFSSTVKKEYIIVVPRGFKFRGKLFKTPERLVQWFKKNPFLNSPYSKKEEYRSNYQKTITNNSYSNNKYDQSTYRNSGPMYRGGRSFVPNQRY